MRILIRVVVCLTVFAFAMPASADIPGAWTIDRGGGSARWRYVGRRPTT